MLFVSLFERFFVEHKNLIKERTKQNFRWKQKQFFKYIHFFQVKVTWLKII